MPQFLPQSCPLPQSLQMLSDPPKTLRFLGDLAVLQYPLLAVVGAREILPRTREWMENELGAVLQNLPLGIVSGGARGVDQVAHRLAIRCQRPTLIVVPSGLRRLYPQNLLPWVGRPQVLFMSEYEDEQTMRKHHFFFRNRLIVGMSPLTLVVQAKERSGTMLSARMAIEQGKAVATLPGFPGDPAFSGNNQLLYEGADLVRNANDLRTWISSSCA